MAVAQKLCDRCGARMNKSGEIRAGPRGGKRPSYRCKQCGYQTIGSYR
ncbi:hypothetical protein [Halomontanus rarus]